MLVGQHIIHEFNVQKMKQLLLHRENPQQNPVTLFSVKDKAESTGWMKKFDEAVPFCDEKSSFSNELDEVTSKQGIGFPYSYGVYIVSCLVGANNPFDLDVGYIISLVFYECHFAHFS